MKRPGRKSTAALSTVATLVPLRRPEPPKALTPAQKRVWRSVIITKAPDYFTPDSWPLLTAYCRATVMADQIATEIDAMPHGDPAIIGARKELLKQQKEQVSQLVTLARSLRLSMQARYRGETAALAHDRANSPGANKKPWQT